jgi:diguanylate cyclase (GGDEF)-like protein
LGIDNRGIGGSRGPNAPDRPTAELRPPENNREIVARALRTELGERLNIDPTLLSGLDAEAGALVLSRLNLIDRMLGLLPPMPESERPGVDPAELEIVASTLRDELAEELQLPAHKFQELSAEGAARTLTELRARKRRLRERGAEEPVAPPPPVEDSRGAVGQAIRESLASELGVSPGSLVGLSPDLVARTLSHLIETRRRAQRRVEQLESGGTPAEDTDFRDRRDIVGRVIRDGLADRLDIPPQTVGGISPMAGAVLLTRLAALRSELKKAQDQLSVDEMTGALRRAAGEEAITREIERARRLSHRQLVLVFIDVDELKLVNDTIGHAAGDELLRSFVEVLRARLRSYDLVVRWGGDEFVCVLPQADRTTSARVFSEVADAFARRTGGRTFSIGFATMEEGDTTADIVGRADDDLYQHKRLRDREPGNGTDADRDGEPEASPSGAV